MDAFRDRPIQPLSHLSARVFTRSYGTSASAAKGTGYRTRNRLGLARTIHEPAACECDLRAVGGVARPDRSSECHRHACVAIGPCALPPAHISHSRLAVHE